MYNINLFYQQIAGSRTSLNTYVIAKLLQANDCNYPFMNVKYYSISPFLFCFLAQISAYKAQGKQPPASLFDKLSAHQKKMETIQAQLKQGGKQAVVGTKSFCVFVFLGSRNL